MCSLKSADEVHVPVWFHRGALKAPPPSIPLVLVGPGTGCAPFRAFIEERAILSANELAAPILIFFGCRNEANDFLYKDFWFSHTKNVKYGQRLGQPVERYNCRKQQKFGACCEV